jgi:hypothetical protein
MLYDIDGIIWELLGVLEWGSISQASGIRGTMKLIQWALVGSPFRSHGGTLVVTTVVSVRKFLKCLVIHDLDVLFL